jgi:hypothetical protein
VGSVTTLLQRGFVDTIFWVVDRRGYLSTKKVASFTSFVDKSVDKRQDTALALLAGFVR